MQRKIIYAWILNRWIVNHEIAQPYKAVRVHDFLYATKLLRDEAHM